MEWPMSSATTYVRTYLLVYRDREVVVRCTYLGLGRPLAQFNYFFLCGGVNSIQVLYNYTIDSREQELATSDFTLCYNTPH